jgi:type I restriction enzyme M protein
MADERTRPPHNQDNLVPAKYAWPTLLAKSGDDLFDHYRHILDELGKQKGTLGLIFGKAQNKFQAQAKLTRVIADLIDTENWSSLNVDVKGDAYEDLLEKNAQDTKSGAGQYFTPRALIQAMVTCIAPKPGERICDPACGTGGFLFTAYDYISHENTHLTSAEKRHLRNEAFTGWELVQATALVCAMNLMPHGIGSETSVPVRVADALAADPGERYQVVLANPPFGKKSSTVIVGEDGKTTTEKNIIERDDFWATTSNKQLNFVQHIKTLLDIHGRAAVVVPDNVLFLDKKPASETPWTKKLWIYDLRTNKHFTLKTNPMRVEDLTEFVALYNPGSRNARTPTWLPESPEGRWRAYDYEELAARDKASLDIFWLKDDSLADSDNLPPPEVIAQEIVDDLEAALEQLRLIVGDMAESG